MSRYDDEQVIALLRDAVPPPPDAADRMALVRVRAGRQRALVWTQALGAVASVLLVVGVAAAVAGPGGRGDTVPPVSEPVDALADALTREKSVRFEASLTPLSKDPEARALASHATGAATRDGEFQVKGQLAFFTMEPGGEDMELRHVGGVSYTSLPASENPPPGKRWMSVDDTGPGGIDELRRLLRMVDAMATGVRHTGSGEARGEPVAEYELTIPAKWAGGEDVEVGFALDAQRRLRRVEAEFSWHRVTGGGEASYGSGGSGEVVATAAPPPTSDPRPSMVWATPTARPSAQPSAADEEPPPPPPAEPLEVRVEVELFGYGDDVRITAPPAAEVITADALYQGHQDRESAEQEAYLACRERAGSDRAAADACMERHGYVSDVTGADGCRTLRTRDGSTSVMCTESLDGLVGEAPPAPAATASPGP